MTAGVKGAAPQRFLLTHVEGDEKSVSMCDSGGAGILQRKYGDTGADSKGMSPEQ